MGITRLARFLLHVFLPCEADLTGKAPVNVLACDYASCYLEHGIF
jgi:hypothetical protein